MKNKSTNYLLPVHLGETALEIDGTTFMVESRYLGEDSIFVSASDKMKENAGQKM